MAIDDRCATWACTYLILCFRGIVLNLTLDDFATPEYTTYGVVKQDKWERCLHLANN